MHSKNQIPLGVARWAIPRFVTAAVFWALAAGLCLRGSGLLAAIALLPALLGVLFAFFGIRALLAAASPPTNVVGLENPVVRGQSVRVKIRQSGPIRFKSFRADLVCERVEKAKGSRKV